MTALLDRLGIRVPLVGAPMAGGPGSPELVVAVGLAGGLGFLAAGYQSAGAVAEQVALVRASRTPFGVNVFAPNPQPVDPAAYLAYRRLLEPEADRFGVQLPEVPREDDDDWAAKIDLLLTDPVPVVSFTFGLPTSAEVAALRRAGSLVAQTVTSVEEARLAVEVGVDVLAVQSSAAGGHSGTFTPQRFPVTTPLVELVAHVQAAAPLPVLAAGALTSSAEVAGVLRAGADAAVVGTLLLLADESGASAPHRAALIDPATRGTTVTRAFTGRPARGLRNGFIDRYDELAPAGYPAVHHLTSPLRRAAAAAGDPDLVNLWAGTGYRSARPGPAADVVASLASGL